MDRSATRRSISRARRSTSRPFRGPSTTSASTPTTRQRPHERGLVKFRYDFDPHRTASHTRWSRARAGKTRPATATATFFRIRRPLPAANQLLSAYNPDVVRLAVQVPRPERSPQPTRSVCSTASAQTASPTAESPVRPPAQYAAFNTGWQGAGPAWQAFHLYDNSLTYQYQTGYSVFRTTFYNSLYDNPWDRTFQLPFYTYPGSNASWRDTGVNESGFISSDNLLGTNNDFELGMSYMNDAYFLTQNGNDNGTLSQQLPPNPTVWETALLRARRLPSGQTRRSRHSRTFGTNTPVRRTRPYLDSAALGRRPLELARRRARLGRIDDHAAQSGHAQQDRTFPTMTSSARAAAPTSRVPGSTRSVPRRPRRLKPERGVDRGDRLHASVESGIR